MVPEIQTGTGMPKNQPVPKDKNVSPKPLIGNPWVHNIVNPLATVSIASVATKGGTLNFVIVQPLKAPSAAPVKMPASIAPKIVNPMYKLLEGISIPFFSKPAVIAPQSANIEPTERSIPAVSTINVIPVEMQIFTEICRITFQRFETLRNLSDNMLRARHNKKSAMSDWNLRTFALNKSISIV